VKEISEKLHEFLEENFPGLQEDKVPIPLTIASHPPLHRPIATGALQ